MTALSASEEGRGLHLIERTNMEFSVQSTIAPGAMNLTRFKVSGKLPSLVANFSNLKYKGLMRLIDIAIPNFDDGSSPAPTALPTNRPDPLKLPSNFFRKAEEYGVEDGDHSTVGDENESDSRDDESDSFVDAESGPGDVSRHFNCGTLSLTFLSIERKSGDSSTLVRVCV